jgi:chloramphenicol O-acetyltransferase type A
MGRFLDLETWKRRQHYALFRAMPNPWFSICMDVDVTVQRERARRDGDSFFLGALFAAMRAANQTEAFRMRLRAEEVWVHDRVDASTTILMPDETFRFVQLPGHDRFADYQASSRREMDRVRADGTLGAQPGRDDLIYHSTLPWIRFTAFSNPFGSTDDAIPRLVFGKCFEAGGRWHMPIAVEVHHALVDGLDVARFAERFQAGLDEPSGSD